LVFADESGAELVQEIAAPVRDAGLDAGDFEPGFLTEIGGASPVF